VDGSTEDAHKINGTPGAPLAWSWVDSKSPLMGSQEEAEWILERLIERLGEELRAVHRG
jgi:potassium channel subfamily K